MNQLFKNILAFVLPLIIITVIMDLYLEDMNSLYKEKARGIKKEAHKIEVLILGNSHATYGVNPSYFTHYAFNLANTGQSIYFDKELTLQNLGNLKNLKYVLISLDYHSLYFSSQRGERNIWSYYGNGIKHPREDYFKANISPFLFGYDPRVSFSFLRKDLIYKLRFKNNTPYLNFDTEKGVLKTDTLIKGFISFSGTNANEFNIISYKNRINKFNDLIANASIENNTEKKDVLSELDELIRELQKEDITPIFFSTPTFNDYNLLLNPINIKRNNTVADSLCEKYNIEFWDYATNNNFIKNDFFNGDHLNKKGAKKFSVILDSKLKLSNN